MKNRMTAKFALVISLLMQVIYVQNIFAIFSPDTLTEKIDINNGIIEVVTLRGHRAMQNHCRGVRIGKDLIVTMAHCFATENDRNAIQVIGSERKPTGVYYLFSQEIGGKERMVSLRVNALMTHPGYNPAPISYAGYSRTEQQNSMMDDLAILILEPGPLEMVDPSPIKLPFHMSSLKNLNVQITGYHNLNVLEPPLFDEVRSATSFFSIRKEYSSSKRLLIRGHGSTQVCYGDSGSGLINPKNNALIGILTHHIEFDNIFEGLFHYFLSDDPSKPYKSCGKRGFATNIYPYTDWIIDSYLYLKEKIKNREK